MKTNSSSSSLAMKEGWDKVPLNEYITLIDYRGRTPAKTESGVRLITAKNVKLGYLQKEPQEFINPDDYDSWMTRGIPKYGDVIFTTEAPLGNVAQINTEERLAFAQRIIVMQPRADKIDQTFLKYMLLSPEIRKKIFDNGTGATVTGIKSKLLKQIQIPIPPLSEQEEIVAILDEVFTAIVQARANIEKNIENANEFFQSRLNEIFSWKGEGWEWKRLGDVCYGFQYGTSSKSDSTGKIPVLRMGNIRDGVIDWSDLKYTDNSTDIDKYLLEKDDVLFNRTNSAELVGKSAIYKGERDAIFAGYLIRLLRNKELLDGDFLNFYLMSPKVREYGLSIMSSSVHQANISASKLENYKISLPNIGIQREIASNIILLKLEIMKLEESYNSKLSVLDELKKSLLQKAFSGELT